MNKKAGSLRFLAQIANQPGRKQNDLDLDVIRRIDAACRRFAKDLHAGLKPAIDAP